MHTPETKIKISLSKKGCIPWNKGKQTPRGRYSNNWKGNNVTYSGLHAWIQRVLGKSSRCQHCKKDGFIGRKIHWANISGKYKRNLSDWIRLCAHCHKLFDWGKKRRPDGIARNKTKWFGRL